MKLKLQKSRLNNDFAVTAIINGNEIELRRIFIDMEKGESIWFPKIKKVLFEGLHASMGFEITETITP